MTIIGESFSSLPAGWKNGGISGRSRRSPAGSGGGTHCPAAPAPASCPGTAKTSLRARKNSPKFDLKTDRLHADDR